MKDLVAPFGANRPSRFSPLGVAALALFLTVGTLHAQLPNPVCYIPFDEGTGATAHDAAGTNNATLIGGASWTTGIVGANALGLPGTGGSYADIPADVLNTTQSFTVCAWVNLNTTGGYQTFVSEDSGYQSAFFLQKRADSGPGHMSPWRYFSDDGLGLLEYLKWCEDLHMQPVLAVYAGYSLDGEYVSPGADLAPYVQDALNEIQYVTGGTNTTWGAQRAADGHPKPFPLRYVEIGNEDFFDGSGSYNGRFAQFYDAIKASYPNLQVIATTGVTSRTRMSSTNIIMSHRSHSKMMSITTTAIAGAVRRSS
jgi:hypothetical protein